MPFCFVPLLAWRKKTGNDEIDRLFGAANSLHGNFYENWLTANMVRLLVDDVERFMGMLDEVN